MNIGEVEKEENKLDKGPRILSAFFEKTILPIAKAGLVYCRYWHSLALD